MTIEEQLERIKQWRREDQIEFGRICKEALRRAEMGYRICVLKMEQREWTAEEAVAWIRLLT
jgi:hypothetical protein